MEFSKLVIATEEKINDVFDNNFNAGVSSLRHFEKLRVWCEELEEGKRVFNTVFRVSEDFKVPKGILLDIEEIEKSVLEYAGLIEMKEDKMDYKEIRNLVEKMGNEDYRDLIKALVSYEKGINDEDALEKLYVEFMDSDTKGLLHEDFDYMIDELRDKGEIDETARFVPDRDDFISATGNLLKDAEEVLRKNKDGEVFSVCNVTLVSE